MRYNLKKTRVLWNRALKSIAGGNHLISKNPNIIIPNLWPTYYSSAKGFKIKDINGNEFSDLYLMGVGTNILGYSNSKIDNDVIKILKKSNMSTLNCPEEVYLAEKLLKINPWANKVRFSKTGGEANALSVRIARAYQNEKKFKVAINGYHGWHDWYLSANLKKNKKFANLLMPNVKSGGVPKILKNSSIIFQNNNISEFNKLLKNNPDIGIVKIELFRDEMIKEEFLLHVREVTKKKDIVLIFDECTSGFRETFGGIYKKYGIEPDLIVFGKALGNGYPITAVLGKEKVMNSFNTTFISSTFWTERSGYAAALSTLKEMNKLRSWEKISKKGKIIKKKWREIAKKYEIDLKIRGISSIPQFYINSQNFFKYKTFITQEFLKDKILAANIIYISTAHTKTVFKKYFDKLNDIFHVVKKCEDGDNIDNYLKTKPIKYYFRKF